MRTLFLILLLFTTLIAVGQKQFIGVIGGYNITNFTPHNTAADRLNRTGLAAGLQYQILFNKRYFIGVDLLYSERGSYSSSFNLVSTTSTTTIQGRTFSEDDYLFIPIKAGLQYGDRLFGFANIGVTPAMLLKSQVTIPTFSGLGTTFPQTTFDSTNNLKAFDLGGIVEVGGGYNFSSGIGVFACASYQESFFPFLKKEQTSLERNRHYGTTISLGLKYALTESPAKKPLPEN